jgi:flavin reductase (DIM6/NTAB) family NADH-FMN oxidoreductase RutF
MKHFRVPQRVVLATCRKPDGAPNAMVLGWWMQTSHQPHMMAISVGHTRHSHELIDKAGDFVLAVPPAGLAEEVYVLGTKSGRDVDKFAETGVTALDATKVTAPLVAECLVNLECEVVSSLATGDHTIFAGRVVASHLSDSDDCPLLVVSPDPCYVQTGGKGQYLFGKVRPY